MQYPTAKTYYLNALFDLQLGDYPVNAVTRSAAEMSILFLFCCKTTDRLVIDIDIDDSYYSYLDKVGVSLPGLITRNLRSDIQSHSDGVAWGWTKAAVSRLEANGVICKFPDLEVVKKINNRKFCNEIAKNLSLGVPQSYFCLSLDDFYKSINKLKNNYPLVIKPAFGGSGFGLRVINSEDEVASCGIYVESFFNHGGAVIEPWCKRLYDLSTNLNITSDGKIDTIRHQRLFSNAYGSFFGIYIAPSDPYLDTWQEKLEETACRAATQVRNTGYFGPVGFDSFVYKSKNDQEILAPVIEINGRHVMSHIAYAVRNQIAQNQYCFFRMVSKKRCKLPETYVKWEQIFAHNHKDVVLLTPLRVKHEKEWIQPNRNAFFIFASSEQELFDKDRQLRLFFNS
jgi:hypothetical protein